METLKTSGYAPVNGISMYYELHGEGSMPLVLIHGGGSTIETTFGSMIPLLAKTRQLIAVELQAHGRTSDRDAPESFVQDADDVASLLKHLNINKADIFGFSNGGSTTLQLGIRHPELVSRLIVAAGACKRDGFMPGFFEFMPQATIEVMPVQLKEGFLKVNPDKDKLQAMFEKDKQRMVTFKDWPDESLRAIKAPTLFMASYQDVITPAHTLQMAGWVEGSQVIILPGTHGSFIGAADAGDKYRPENGSKLPQITTDLINDFLNE